MAHTLVLTQGRQQTPWDDYGTSWSANWRAVHPTSLAVYPSLPPVPAAPLCSG